MISAMPFAFVGIEISSTPFAHVRFSQLKSFLQLTLLHTQEGLSLSRHSKSLIKQHGQNRDHL
ncbi:protein of unknown function [Xenorhabdus bovienii]|uniref:Uncharacterized protein n=1 Tax=Xenorhabdus bovienii TaxID=40576 RepID=A0A0B6XAE7_XENBV|nr:protein of unknown function [Xenorhabdus bovienii]